MSIWTKSAGKELKNHLMFCGRHEFQRRIFNTLYPVKQSLKKSDDLLKIDSAGIDLFTTQEKHLPKEVSRFNEVYQCKGFEKPEFTSSQLKQCRDSIKSFVKSEYDCDNYYLAFNQIVKPPFRKQLNELLQEIVIAKKAKSAEFLDIYLLIDHLANSIEKHLIKDLIFTSQRFYDQYKDVMELNDYYSDVPFKLNSKTSREPLKYVMNRAKIEEIANRQSAVDYVKGRYFFIISEFGFGKTRLLLELFRKYKSQNQIPLYLPMPAFDDADLSSAGNICKKVMILISEHHDLDYKQFTEYFQLARRILQKILCNNPNIVIMFDGLDEHRYLNKFIGTKHFFHSLTDFKAIFLFGVRKSFWDDKKGNFLSAIGKQRTIQDKIQLTDWSNKDITKYIDLLLSTGSFTEEDTVFKFQDLVKKNNYDKFFGDIPKRPLFLNMIIRKLNNKEEIKESNIHELYESFFIDKFIRDKEGSLKELISKRELSLEGDLLKQCYDIIEATEKIAEKSIHRPNEGNILELKEVLTEKEISQVLNDFGFKEVLEILLHSVLVSTSGRINNNLKLRFAHKSYQEYFVARYLRSSLLSKNFEILNSILPNKNIHRFLLNMLQQHNSILENINATEFDNYSLGDELKKLAA